MKKIVCLLAIAALCFVSYSVFGAETCTVCKSCNALTSAEKELGFEALFDGKVLCPKIWQGSIEGYPVRKDGTFFCDKGGNLLTVKEYDNFVFRFEFKLPNRGNNGVGIRTKLGVNPAYDGMEIQILADDYAEAKPWQKHGSIYGVVPAKTGALKPNGEWNTEEIVALGNQIKVTVNGKVIVDADISKVKPIDGSEHPGLLNKSGSIGFLGHGDQVVFRNIRVKAIKGPACLTKISDVESKSK